MNLIREYDFPLFVPYVPKYTESVGIAININMPIMYSIKSKPEVSIPVIYIIETNIVKKNTMYIIITIKRLIFFFLYSFPDVIPKIPDTTITEINKIGAIISS